MIGEAENELFLKMHRGNIRLTRSTTGDDERSLLSVLR